MMSRPFIDINSSGAVNFDGLEAVCWFVKMRSDLTSPRVTNISAGELYTFVFTQDAVGGHKINWPSNCVNAAPIDTAPNSTTVQNFIGNTGTTLYANIPPTGSAATP